VNSNQATVQTIPVPLERLPETIPNLREAVEAGKALEGLIGDPGIKAIFDGVASRQRELTRLLIQKQATDSGAEYAQITGHLKGLAEIEGIAASVVQRGKEAAPKLRAAEQEEIS
jgi:hypothetical protein